MATNLPHSNKITLPITFIYMDSCSIKKAGHNFYQVISIGVVKNLYEAKVVLKQLTPTEYLDLLTFFRLVGEFTYIQINWLHLAETHIGTIKPQSFKTKDKDEVSFVFQRQSVIPI